MEEDSSSPGCQSRPGDGWAIGVSVSQRLDLQPPRGGVSGCLCSDNSLTGPADACLALEQVFLSPQTEWTCRDRLWRGAFSPTVLTKT